MPMEIVDDAVTEAPLHVKLGMSVVIHLNSSTCSFPLRICGTKKCDKRQLRIELARRQLGGTTVAQEARQQTSWESSLSAKKWVKKQIESRACPSINHSTSCPKSRLNLSLNLSTSGTTVLAHFLLRVSLKVSEVKHTNQSAGYRVDM